MLKLKKAAMNDCEHIHRMQVLSFQSLLTKYNDRNTNPAVEPKERIIEKMNQDVTDYYLILVDDKTIGSIRIVRVDENLYRISPMFILPEYQGKGYAQQTIICVETLYPQATGWSLDTIKEEAKLCHLYEKLGYKATGKEELIQDNMTIVYYAKQCLTK